MSQTWEQRGSDFAVSANMTTGGTAMDLSSDGATMASLFDCSPTSPFCVKVSDWNGTNWIQRGTNLLLNESFPSPILDVALSGDATVVAFSSEAQPYPWPNTNGGVVDIMQWNGSSWVQLGDSIPASQTQSPYPGVFERNVGRSIDLSDDGYTLIVGAAESARVYAWNGNSWIQQGQDLTGATEDDFGFSVSISGDGNRIAISSPQTDPVGTLSSWHGKTRVYEWQSNSWVQLGTTILGETSLDWSGDEIALSSDGNAIVIGARNNDGAGNNAGHARVFNWTGTSWQQLGNDMDGEYADDGSGCSVGINDDGTIVAIGATGNSDGGTQSGHTRVYKWNGSIWFQKGGDLDGSNQEEYLGSTVKLSGDGLTLLVGAKGTSTVNPYAQIYHYCSGDPVIINQSDSTTLIADYSGADGYQWFDCNSGLPLNGETGQTLSLTANGSFSVEAYEDVCTYSSSCFTVNTVRVQEKEIEPQVQVYPNPSSGTIYVELGEWKGAKIVLTAADGRRVYDQKGAEQSSIQLNLDLPTGIYFLHLSTARHRKSVRVVVNKR